jgi:MoaA/NifB/PqqE/SkfB family radical SAM enzyme
MAKPENLKYIDFNIGVLHLELTSRCNALCPMCARTTGLDHDGELLKKRDDLPLIDTDPNVLAKMLEDMKPFLPNHVFINGNFGDPIMYPNLLEVIKMCKDAGVPQVTLSTNGSAQTEAWWVELATIMRKPDKVIFAIDGLEDTNHLYRVNTKWSTIMRNAKAFISNGGIARWDYIGFAHNEHQIDEARQLAEDMGFVKFRYKKSNRYVIPKDYSADPDTPLEEETLVKKTEIKFVAKQHVKKQEKTSTEKKAALETILAAPKKQSNTSEKVDEVIKKHKTFDNYVQSTDIECQTARDKSIFVDYKGYVWPCCWQGHYYSSIGEDKGSQRRIDDRIELENKYGKDFNNLNKHSIFDILRSPYYAKDLVNSWQQGQERLYICGKTCGKELDFRGNGEQNFEDTEMNEYAE